MRQLDLISHSRADKKRPHRLRGFLSSFLFHALLVAFVLELSFLCRSHLALDSIGTIPGSQVISLETIVIVAPPAPLGPPAPAAQITPVIAKVAATTTPAFQPNPFARSLPPEPLVSAHPEIGLPILPGNPTTPMQATSSKAGTPVRHETVVASSGGGLLHLRPGTDKFISSFGAGFSVLPRPPYPSAARSLLQSGIVRMLVEFDRAGNVARAEVARSSGVALLDRETRLFIRDHWHSTTYAGRAISVPVEYTLTSL